MIVAIAILGGAAMFFLFLSLISLILTISIRDLNQVGLIGFGIAVCISVVLLIPVYVLAISAGASLWTIIIGAFAMATPIFLLLLNFTGWVFPLFLVGYLAQITLFVLALLKV